MTGAGKSISLILGSGGARGLAHIGIIRWLEEHDYRIASVSGSSIGAMIGGVMNPAPIAPTFNDNTDMTIAVNLGGIPVRLPRRLPTDSLKNGNQAPLHEKILQFISSLTADDETEEDGNWDMFDISDQSFDAMQATIARQKLAAYPPDVLIKLPRNVCGTLEFDRAAEMIALGYSRAEQVLGSSMT